MEGQGWAAFVSLMSNLSILLKLFEDIKQSLLRGILFQLILHLFTLVVELLNGFLSLIFLEWDNVVQIWL